MQSTENSNGSGVVLLIAGAVVLSVVSFVLTHLRTIAVIALVLAALFVLGLLLRAAARSLQERAAGKQRTGHRAAEQARQAGQEDMRTAWLRWQLGILPPQHRVGEASFIAARLAETPRADWAVTRLQRHGQAVWSVRDVAARTPLHADVEARLDRVAAMISDLTDEEFDTHRGQADDRYLYHPDHEVRAAYLEGGSAGVEAVMRTISDARARAREDAAAQAAADALAQQRNAALRAMRETRQVTAARDAHAVWEAEAEQIGRQ